MKLQRIENWVADTFTEDSRPDLQKVRRLCKQGSLPSLKVGRHWFIDTVAFGQQNQTEEDRMADEILGQLLA